jgi:hypothetical protein
MHVVVLKCLNVVQPGIQIGIYSYGTCCSAKGGSTSCIKLLNVVQPRTVVPECCSARNAWTSCCAAVTECYSAKNTGCSIVVPE